MLWFKKLLKRDKATEIRALVLRTSPIREKVRLHYENEIRPSYFGVEMHKALPDVIMDIVDAYLEALHEKE